MYMYQEQVMKKEGRGKERALTTHLIKFRIYTHVSSITKFNPYDLCTHLKMVEPLGLVRLVQITSI